MPSKTRRRGCRRLTRSELLLVFPVYARPLPAAAHHLSGHHWPRSTKRRQSVAWLTDGDGSPGRGEATGW